MIKVIHAADVHLDSPFRMEDLQKAQARKNELRAAFSSLIYWAKTENADFLLIAGDLFDSPHPTPDAVDFVLSQFRLIPSCRIIITPDMLPGYQQAIDRLTALRGGQVQVLMPNMGAAEEESA